MSVSAPSDGSAPGAGAWQPGSTVASADSDRSAEVFYAFEHAPVGMAITAPSGQLHVVNPALSELLGRSAEQLVRMSLFDVTHPDDVTEAQQTCAALRRSQDSTCRLEARLLRLDGTVIHSLVSTSKVTDGEGRPSHLVMHIEDVNEYKQLTDQLWRQATHDTLTGLPHRGLLMDRMGNALARHRRDSVSVSVLFVDLDRFKGINDTYGHSTGDRLLEVVAERMTQHVRPGDTVARVGGDEFVILCEQTGEVAAAELVHRLQRVIADPIAVAGLGLSVTASIGSATTVDGHALTEGELLRRADQAMYAVKRAATSTD